MCPNHGCGAQKCIWDEFLKHHVSVQNVRRIVINMVTSFQDIIHDFVTHSWKNTMMWQENTGMMTLTKMILISSARE